MTTTSTLAHERVVHFGDRNALMGIVTHPAAGISQLKPALLFLNAGLIHRVGPFRMHVELARRMAAGAGHRFTSFRLDQSGLGDSAPRVGGMSYEERAVADAREAMDALSARFGINRFIAIGLCAGAMNAHRAALAASRSRRGRLYPMPISR